MEKKEIEIEVKAKVKSFEPIIEKLVELGCKISEPVTQKDIIFLKEGENPKNVLRIRESGGKFLFTLKRDITTELYCIEKELEISDPVAMRDIMIMLGFEESVRVDKQRRKCTYKEYEICLDDVEGLGTFIEIEKLSEKEDSVAEQEMLAFLESLGVDISQRVFHGYDTLILAKKK